MCARFPLLDCRGAEQDLEQRAKAQRGAADAPVAAALLAARTAVEKSDRSTERTNERSADRTERRFERVEQRLVRGRAGLMWGEGGRWRRWSVGGEAGEK